MEAAKSGFAFCAAMPVICSRPMNARGIHPILQMIAPDYATAISPTGTSLMDLMICETIW